MKKSLMIFAALAVTMAASAQEKRAWEVGVGASAYQFNRVNFVGFTTTGEGHFVNMQLRHVVYGGNVYVAKELSNAFALDFQGTLGKADRKWLAQGGLGLQWRMGRYFGSRQIDPYLRLGANYMYKGFDIYYADSRDGMDWNMANNLNKDGADGRHLFAAAAGVGTNMWLNDRFGIGLQGDYLVIPKPHVAHSLQGTVRVMWRLGKTAAAPVTPVVPAVEYREVTVRDTVFVEQIIEVDRGNVYDLTDAIHFDFDRHDLRPEYATTIEKIAGLLKSDTSRRYLITGYADARGTADYNQTLSLARARTVMDALVARGVPAEMLKAAGGGKRLTHAARDASDHTREGDRKVTIEHITNPDYWEVF